MDSLSDRLKILGFKTASSLKAPGQRKHPSLEDVISGSVLTNSSGSFVVKESHYPYQYQHGRVTFTNEFGTSVINEAARINPSPASLGNMLFIDTETSGLSGGAGTFAFLVGIGKFQEDGFNLQQFIIRDPGEETAMLLHFTNVVNPETVFVSFNGKSFDIPLLQNRLVVNRMPGRIRELQHLDVLHISRRIWRRQLASCKLKDLESAVLHFSRSAEDVPGWMVPDIYFDYLRTGDPGPLADVIYHNAQDVVSLAALLIHITELFEFNSSNMEISTNDLIAISRIYWDMHNFETAFNILGDCRGRKLNRDQSIQVNSMLGQYHKIKRNPNEAMEYWKVAAEQGDPYSCVDLAKYFEHELKDIPAALDWSLKCKSLLENDLKAQINVTFKKDLEKRIVRLKVKGSQHV